MSTEKQCQRCENNFPLGYCHIIYTSNGYLNVCGICALKIKNEIHGTSDTKFQGTNAEQLRLKAIKWLMKNK